MPFKLNQKECGLLVIDVQGKLARSVHKAKENIEQTRILIQVANLLGMPVCYVEHCPEQLGHTASELLTAFDNPLAITKQTFSLWQHPGVPDQLTLLPVKHWLVCGIECHVCVYQSVSDLLENDYSVSVITDAVSSRKQTDKKIGLSAMQQQGAFLSSVEMAIFELLKTPKHPAFKQVLSLIK